MSDTRFCGNPDELLSYLYDESEPERRLAFEQHLRECETCAREVEAFSGLRSTLASWTPPETMLGFRIARDREPVRRAWFSFPVMPAWAQLGAAALLVGMAVGISGLEVRYDRQGVTVRTGWQRSVETPTAATTTTATAVVPAAAESTPWRSDLAALEQRLRTELQRSVVDRPATQLAASAARPVSDEAVLTRVRTLIEASEARQNREMALRMAQVVRDVDTQRRTDLARVTDGMGVIEGRAVSAVAQQRQMIDYLLRVSSQREPQR